MLIMACRLRSVQVGSTTPDQQYHLNDIASYSGAHIGQAYQQELTFKAETSTGRGKLVLIFVILVRRSSHWPASYFLGMVCQQLFMPFNYSYSHPWLSKCRNSNTVVTCAHISMNDVIIYTALTYMEEEACHLVPVNSVPRTVFTACNNFPLSPPPRTHFTTVIYVLQCDILCPPT